MPGTFPELREWPFHSKSIFPEIGVVPRLLILSHVIPTHWGAMPSRRHLELHYIQRRQQRQQSLQLLLIRCLQVAEFQLSPCMVARGDPFLRRFVTIFDRQAERGIKSHKAQQRLLWCCFFGQRLMGETKWEKGVETASCDFLRFLAVSCGFLQFSAAPNHLPGRSRTKSSKICENLRQAAVSPFSLPFSAAQVLEGDVALVFFLFRWAFSKLLWLELAGCTRRRQKGLSHRASALQISADPFGTYHCISEFLP